MLTEYKGPANSNEIFRHVVGETIKAAFTDNEGRVVLILGSGEGLVIAGVGGGSPAYWKMKAQDVSILIEHRKAKIEQNLAELRDLPGVTLP